MFKLLIQKILFKLKFSVEKLLFDSFDALLKKKAGNVQVRSRALYSDIARVSANQSARYIQVIL